MAHPVREWLTTTTAKLVGIIILVLLGSTMAFYVLELKDGQDNADFFSSLWWAVVTVTTTGYGDIYPRTTGGRIVGILVMLTGISVVSTLTGNLASMLVEQKARKRKGLLTVKLHNHVIILGWNAFAPQLVKLLVETKVLDNSHLVVVTDLSSEAREEIAFQLDLGDRLHFVWGNVTQENVVNKARPDSAKVVYILTNQGMTPKEADQQAIYAALTTRCLAPKVPLYGEVSMPENREHLLRAGVNDILVRGDVATRVLAMMGVNPSAWTFLQNLIGIRGASLLGVKDLSAEEQGLRWKDLVERMRGVDGSLPLALCHVSKTLSLQDMLDEGSALDQFVLELFQSSGRDTTLGRQGPQVTVNPPDHEPLKNYDTVLYLKAPTVAR